MSRGALPRWGPSPIHAGNGRACRSLTAKGGGFHRIEADLSRADLRGANLRLVRLIGCKLDDAIFDEVDVTECHVLETIGRPKPPSLLRIKDRSPLTGEDAWNFFNPPAIVEVYLTGRLTELELGCYHFHLGDMY